MGNFVTNSQTNGCAMILLRPWLLFLCGLFCITSAYTQEKVTFSTKSKKALQYYVDSEPYYLRRQYWQAIELLEKALNKDEEFTEAQMRIATCYRLTAQLEAAAIHYNLALDLGLNQSAAAS